MNTLRNYVESVFMNLPQTPEMAKRKQEMLMNMEAKYQQLLADGKNENEAIGAALAEFGHVDDSSPATAATPNAEIIPEGAIHLSAAEADDYLDHRHKFAFAMAAGVFLCIMAPAAMILFREIPQFFDVTARVSQNTIDILALVPLFVFVAAAVALFIIYGARDSEYGLNNQIIHLDAQTRADLSKEQRESKSRTTVAIAAGVVLCIHGTHRFAAVGPAPWQRKSFIRRLPVELRGSRRVPVRILWHPNRFLHDPPFRQKQFAGAAAHQKSDGHRSGRRLPACRCRLSYRRIPL